MKKLLIIPMFLLSCGREKELLKENEVLKHDLKECGYLLYETEKIVAMQETDLELRQQQIDSLTKSTKCK